jgi:hypothetical protein
LLPTELWGSKNQKGRVANEYRPDEHPDSKESRRLFLKQTGKKALWAAPLVTVIVTASSLRADPPVCLYPCVD